MHITYSMIERAVQKHNSDPDNYPLVLHSDVEHLYLFDAVQMKIYCHGINALYCEKTGDVTSSVTKLATTLGLSRYYVLGFIHGWNNSNKEFLHNSDYSSGWLDGMKAGNKNSNV